MLIGPHLLSARPRGDAALLATMETVLTDGKIASFEKSIAVVCLRDTLRRALAIGSVIFQSMQG